MNNILLDLLISIILSIIDIYLIEYYLNHRINLSKNNIYFYLTGILLFIPNNSSNFRNPIINTIFIIIVLIMTINKYKLALEQIKTFLSVFLLLRLGTLCLLLPIIEWIFNIQLTFIDNNRFVFYYMFIKIVIKYIMFLTIHFIQIRPSKGFHRSHKTFKIISILFTFYFGIFLLSYDDRIFYFPSVGRTFTFVIIVYTVTLIAFDRYQTKHERIEMQMIQTHERMLAEKRYIEKKKEADEDIRRMRHDLKNSYYIINGYADENNVKEIKKFIESKIGKLNESASLIHVGNHNIDSLIDEKICLMKEKDIHYFETISNINIGNIEITDLSLLIGLALDNAIEAAETVEGYKEIHFKAKNRQNYLILHFSNSIVPGSHPQFSKTSKLDNPILHGFGVKGIQQFAKTYNGEAKYTIEYGKVTLRVSLLIK